MDQHVFWNGLRIVYEYYCSLRQRIIIGHDVSIFLTSIYCFRKRLRETEQKNISEHALYKPLRRLANYLEFSSIQVSS